MKSTVRSQFNPAGLITVIVMCLLVAGLAMSRAQWLPKLQAIVQPEKTENHPAHKAGPAITHDSALPKQPPNNHVDCTKVPCLALTFDDGPHPQQTTRLLDILDREKAHATFFLVGSRVPGQEVLVRRMFYAGHEIGNHSWNHADMTKLSPTDILNQVNQTQAAIAAANVPAPKLFRPPYGAVNATVRSTVPMTLALWNDDPLDWKGEDPAKLSESIIAYARPGGVIDLHDIYPVTVDAMDIAIPVLKTKYHLVTFSEMTNVQPGQRGEYFGR